MSEKEEIMSLERPPDDVKQFLWWLCETELNLEGLIGRLQDDEIASYFCKGTSAIICDLETALAPMKKAVDHTKTAITIAEAEDVVRGAI